MTNIKMSKSERWIFRPALTVSEILAYINIWHCYKKEWEGLQLIYCFFYLTQLQYGRCYFNVIIRYYVGRCGPMRSDAVINTTAEYSYRNGAIWWQISKAKKAVSRILRWHSPFSEVRHLTFPIWNIWTWQNRSRSRSKTFAMEPFDGWYQNL